MLSLNTTYVNIGVPRADGELLCNAWPLKAPANVATLSDITQRTAAREIEHLAFYDPLTHLPNRRLMMDRLQQAFATSARAGLQGALLCLDLDHFKTLNDTLGHDMGDVLLLQVAQRLTACVRESDTVARLGGDEWVATSFWCCWKTWGPSHRCGRAGAGGGRKDSGCAQPALPARIAPCAQHYQFGRRAVQRPGADGGRGGQARRPGHVRRQDREAQRHPLF